MEQKQISTEELARGKASISPTTRSDFSRQLRVAHLQITLRVKFIRRYAWFNELIGTDELHVTLEMHEHPLQGVQRLDVNVGEHDLAAVIFARNSLDLHERRDGRG